MGGDQYGFEETKQRLQKILRGALSGPPTRLKDIPTRTGKPRKLTRRGACVAGVRAARPERLSGVDDR